MPSRKTVRRAAPPEVEHDSSHQDRHEEKPEYVEEGATPALDFHLPRSQLNDMPRVVETNACVWVPESVPGFSLLSLK